MEADGQWTEIPLDYKNTSSCPAPRLNSVVSIYELYDLCAAKFAICMRDSLIRFLVPFEVAFNLPHLLEQIIYLFIFTTITIKTAQRNVVEIHRDRSVWIFVGKLIPEIESSFVIA